MPRCSFCGTLMEPGTGSMFVKNDGKIFNFCSMKCNKNLTKLKRSPKKITWTRAYRKEKKSRISAEPAKPALKKTARTESKKEESPEKK